MKCKKCGYENIATAKFCEKCGTKLEPNEEVEASSKVIKPEVKEPKKTKKDNSQEVNIKIEEPIKTKVEPKPQKDNIFKKIWSLPLSIKIISGVVILLVIIAIIVLIVLLNNPMKKVEDYIEDYYATYDVEAGQRDEKNRDELVKIGNILRSKKQNEEDIKSIEEKFTKAIEKWIANYNTNYQNTTELDKAYNKLHDALGCIYKYFNELVIMDQEEYYDYLDQIEDLNNSKKSYLKAKEYEAKNDLSQAYNNFKNVIEADNYYQEAQSFMNTYVKDSIAKFKDEVNKLAPSDTISNLEKFQAYLKQIDYIDDNDYMDGIDISNTQDYKTILSNIENQVLEILKTIGAEYEKNYQINDILDLISQAKNAIDYNSDTYDKLEELEDEYQQKAPVSAISKLDAYDYGFSYGSYRRKINDVEYSNYTSYRINDDDIDSNYDLDGEYKLFKASIVKDSSIDWSYGGYFIIFGDDKELYRSSDLASVNAPVEISLDVTGVKKLKIEFVTESKPTSIWSYDYIYLVEPYLYK